MPDALYDVTTGLARDLAIADIRSTGIGVVLDEAALRRSTRQ